MNNQAISVADYLNSLPDIKNARACQVTIGKTAYLGANYTAIEHYQAGMQAVIDGQKKVGDTSESERFYLLMDKLPPSYLRRPKPVYEIDGREWYVAAYFDQADKNEQHPLGKMFILAAWDLPEKIDQHEGKPRKRTSVAVEFFEETHAATEDGIGQNQPMADAVS